MFDLLVHKNALSATKSLELIQIQLGCARDCKDAEIKLALCGNVDVLLGQMKRLVHRPLSVVIEKHDSSPTPQEAIAEAYLDHANMVADLGHSDLAQLSRKRAEKWG